MINGLTKRGEILKNQLKKEGKTKCVQLTKPKWKKCSLIHKTVFEKKEYRWIEELWVDMSLIFPEKYAFGGYEND